jgi:exopolysaccharide production protein ExoZ
MSEKQNKTMHFSSIQCLRTVATLLIVVGHTTGFVKDSIFTSFIFIANIGIDMFFVISGCVVVHNTYHIANNNKAAISFLKRRLFRAYSNYWAAIVIIALISMVLSRPFTLGENTIHHLLLIPHDSNLSFFPIIWTLSFELMFCFLFVGTIILNRHTKASTYFMWAMIIFTLRIATDDTRGFYTEFLTSPFHYEFVMGCLVGLAIQKDRLFAPLPMLIIGTLLWSVIGLNASTIFNHVLTDNIDDTELRAVMMGIPCAIFVYGCTAFEKQYRPRIHRYFTLVGDASYSLYLVHFPLYIFVVDHFMIRAPGYYLEVILPLAAVGIALIHYRYIEIPLYRTLVRRFC